MTVSIQLVSPASGELAQSGSMQSRKTQMTVSIQLVSPASGEASKGKYTKCYGSPFPFN